MFVYVLSLARTYVRMFVYLLACIFTYLHIFPLSVGGKELWEERVVGRESENRRVGEGGGKWLLQSEFLFLSKFIVGKGLFWFEYEMSTLWRISLSDDDLEED